MAETLNISLTSEQAGWVRARKVQGGYASTSDVIRDLIRHRQAEEWRQLAEEFDQLTKDGAPGPEPVDKIVVTVRKVRKKLREGRRRA